MPLKSPRYLSADAPFRKYRVTPEESWRAGYDTGLTWRHSHKPGGPHAPHAGRVNDADWIDYCQRAQHNREMWLTGFTEGQEDQSVRSLLEGLGILDEHFGSHLRDRERVWHTSQLPFYYDEPMIRAFYWCHTEAAGIWIVGEMFSFELESDLILFDLTHRGNTR